LKEGKTDLFIFWEDDEPRTFTDLGKVIQELISNSDNDEDELKELYRVYKEDTYVQLDQIKEKAIWKEAYMRGVNSENKPKGEEEEEKESKFNIDMDKEEIKKNGLPRKKWIQIIKMRRKGKYICPVCGEELQSMRGISGHMQGHRVEGVRCSVCGEELRTNSELYEHKKRVHGLQEGKNGKKYNIKETDRINSDDLPRIIIDIKKKPIESRTEKEKRIVEDYLEKQIENQTPACPICFKKFESIQSLNSHVIHHNYRGHICLRCGRLFDTNSKKEKHKKKKH